MAEAELTSDLKDRAIAYIFALAVGPTTQDLRIDNSSHQQEACGVKLTVDILDEILMEMLVVDGTVLEAAGLTPLRYLLECFDRAAGVRQGGAQHHQWAVGVAGGVAVEQEPAVQQFATGLQRMVGQFVVTVVKQAEDAQQPAASASGLLQLGGPGAQQAASPVVAELMTTLQSPQRGLDSFLHYMVAELPPEDHADMLRPVVEQLMKRASTMSILGDFSPVLETVIRLLEIKPLALALTTLGKSWLPEAEAARNANNEASRGRLLQLDTLLGSLLAISGLLDRGSIFPASPDVGKELFGDTASSRNSVVESGFRLLRQLQGQLHGLLHVVVKTLLGKGTRSAMLDWLAAAIEWNSGRSKMGCQPFNVASDGLFLNLCGVLLKLCEPFLDLHSGKFFDKVDVRYISGMGLKTRISFQGETRLAASEEEQWKWQEEALARAGNPEAEPAHFILDCFFMTAKALHLGFVTEIQMVFELASNIQREQHVLQRLRANPATPEQHITMTENHVKAVKQMLLLYQGTLVDVELLRKVLSYYRLMAVWLLRLACPSFAAGGSVTLPLPDTCPPHLACIPEYFLLDLIESLTFIAAAAPQVMEENCMEELVVFLVVFMSSATFVRNPHLRYKLAEVLVSWLPNHPNQSMREGTARAQRTLDFLFEAHPLVRSDLVRSLLRVYVDVEQTDRANQFYEKFQMRSKLSMLLHRLWTIPSHREEWKKMAAEDSGTGMYQRFCNMLVNDAIFLLDESIKSLMAMREMEEKLEPPPGRPQPSQQARQRISAQLQETGQHLKYFLQGATSSIHTIQITSQDIAEPFLMKSFLDRSAEMLNYFLKYLTGPERAKLKVKNMEQYSFNPKELLTAICNIYINLATADSSGGFVRSIAGDGRSYREEMFEEAARVLRDHRLMYPERIAELDNLSTQVLAARQSLEQEEMDMGEVPDEFLDPITYSLMADPVLLPTSNVTCDRSNITRHLLSEESDPFNRARLTVHDLVPNTELKARIEAWLASHGRGPSSKAG